MAITTPGDIIRLAFKDAMIFGVGQHPAAEDTNDAFSRLQMMISQWNRKRWLVYQLVTTGIPSTGAVSYSVGVGGDFDIPRADKIESAFFRQTNISPNQPDYGLTIIPSREDYNRITLKTLVAFPEYVFFDSGYPLGYAYFWPVPTASIYSLYITTKQPLQTFTSLAQQLNLPDEYHAAIFYNLQVRLRTAYGKDPDIATTGLARDALNVIRGANAQIPLATMPASLTRKGTYNVYSDTTT